MLRFLENMQFALFVFFTAAYAYQIVYLFVGLIGKGRGGREDAKLHRYAAVVAARNESAVIANLIRTLKEQNYPSELLDIYVIADNCTDNTAQISRQAGAYVYERFNKVQVGKGYALEYLFRHIFEDKGETAYDGFFVFDADNIVDRDFVREMNKMFDTGEYTALTSYRNSQNFCANWISAGYALWFLRESRFLNRPRTQLGVNCAVSGTGFLVSAQAVREDAGWPYHLLTEDIEFSIHEILQGRKIAFCPDAVLYDEQPTTFRQSWRQRMRWSQGYLQVFRDYGARLLRGIFRGSFSCFDMSMAIMPAFVLSTVSILVNLTLGVVGALAGDNLLVAFESVGQMLLNIYLTLLVLGGITTITEWKNIRTSPVKKIVYMFTFPLFMFTYIPISLAAFFCKPQWKPIEHRVSAAHLRSRDRQELLPF